MRDEIKITFLALLVYFCHCQITNGTRPPYFTNGAV